MKKFYLLRRLGEGNSAVIVRLNKDTGEKFPELLGEGNIIFCRKKLGGMGGIYIYCGRKVFISDKEAGFIVCADE
ncbi:MAG: hypothetical protein E7218_06620 [Anaerofustis stercorihominis]|nr:hypothetical protein [Anaerofustis stercorihominis]